MPPLPLQVASTIGVLSPNNDTTPNTSLYSGYLWRQNTSMKWVRRWFCLRPNHCLYYYKTDSVSRRWVKGEFKDVLLICFYFLLQDTQPVGAILLTNHIIELESVDVGKQYGFVIRSEEGTILKLAADTEETANRWLAIMCHASKQSDAWLETSTRNLRITPSLIVKPDCTGYLMKLGCKWRTWSKRYCVLKDACLYFYYDVSSKNSIG